MKTVFEAAQKIQQSFEEHDWQFCFIGGIALQRWARPRLTNDIDLTLLTGFGNEEVFIDTILSEFNPRIENLKEFALKSRVMLLKIDNVGVDISLGGLFFEESAVKRAEKYRFTPKANLRICTAEDLIVFKAFANRLQDWADIQSILIAQEKLEWDYVLEQLSPLVELKEEPEILQKLEKLKTKHNLK